MTKHFIDFIKIKMPMFLLGSFTVYGYQKYVRDEQIFKNGLKRGMNEVYGADFRPYITEEEFNTFYKFYFKR